MKKYILSIILSMLVSNSLAYSQTLDPSLQWKFNGYSSKGKPLGLATTDTNNMMNMAVSGDTSNASATGSATGSIPRKTSDRISDTVNVYDYGVKMDGSSSDENLLQTLYGQTKSQEIVIPGGGKWPGNNSGWVPSASGVRFVNIHGNLVDPTYYVDSTSGLSALNFGDGVTGFVQGTNWDGPAISYSRVNTTNDPSNRAMIAFKQINNGPSGNPQGSNIVEIDAGSTQNSSGSANGMRINLRSGGHGYYGANDIGFISSAQFYGTNWGWNQSWETGDVISYLCPSSGDSNYCFGRTTLEDDYNGMGPEDERSAYDPTKATHSILGLGMGTDGPKNMSANSVWVANKKYWRYQMIVVKDSNGKPFMFYSLPTSYVVGSHVGADSGTSGATAPTWTFNTGDKIVDGELTWTGMGPFHFDIGDVITFGGSNDTTNGWITRFGTLLTTHDIYCYDALIDFSRAAFDPSVAYQIAMRTKANTYIDLSADGTQSGQNNHIFGYSIPDTAVIFKSFGKILLSIADSGILYFQGILHPINGTMEVQGDIKSDNNLIVGGGIQLGGKTKVQILQLSNPPEGLKYFDVNDHVEVTYRCLTRSTCGWYNNNDNYDISIISSLSSEGLTSAGTTISDSLKLSSVTNIVTRSTSGSGVQLPKIIPGTQIVILNRSTNAINVYPDSSSNQIESLGNGRAQDLEPNSSITFIKTSSTEWRIK